VGETLLRDSNLEKHLRESRFLLLALGVFVLALGVRLGHLTQLRASLEGTQLFSLARGDAADHWREAQDILDHDFWLRDRVQWKGPTYSYFLAGLMQFVGREPGALRWPMAFLGALNCLGLVYLARRFLPPAWALLPGALMALHGTLIVFDTELYFPTLLITVNLLALSLATRARRRGWDALLLGWLLGLSATIHPVYLVPALLLTLHRYREARAQGVLVLLGVAVAIAPITLKHVIGQEQPVLISWSGGINIYLGNQPAFDQGSGQGTAAWDRVLRSSEEAGITGEVARDRLYLRLAIRDGLHHPLRALSIVADKLGWLFSPTEIANNFRIYELRQHSLIARALLGHAGWLWWPLGLGIPLAILGGWTLRTSVNRPVVVLALWAMGLALTILISFNTARYRLPLVFFGSIGVSLFVRHAVDMMRARHWGWLARRGVALALLCVVLSLLGREQRRLPAPLQWSQAQIDAASGRPEAAMRAFDAAVAIDPNDPLPRLGLARFALAQRQFDRALGELEAVALMPQLEPDFLVQLHEIRAELFGAQGQLAEALIEIRAARAIGVDDCEWRGRPYFAMGIGSVTDRRLQSREIEILLAQGETLKARRQYDLLRAESPSTGPMARRLQRLGRRLPPR